MGEFQKNVDAFEAKQEKKPFRNFQCIWTDCTSAATWYPNHAKVGYCLFHSLMNDGYSAEQARDFIRGVTNPKDGEPWRTPGESLVEWHARVRG